MKRHALLALALAACGDAEPAERQYVADAGPARDGAVSCRLEGSVTFRLVGGDVEKAYAITVGNDGVAVTRTNAGSTDTTSCVTTLDPGCPGPSVDNADIARLVYAPTTTPYFNGDDVVHGLDLRPVDGQVLVVERDAQKKVSIGDRCEAASSPDCVSPSESLFKLRDFHGELMQYLGLVPNETGARSGACSSL